MRQVLKNQNTFAPKTDWRPATGDTGTSPTSPSGAYSTGTNRLQGSTGVAQTGYAPRTSGTAQQTGYTQGQGLPGTTTGAANTGRSRVQNYTGAQQTGYTPPTNPTGVAQTGYAPRNAPRISNMPDVQPVQPVQTPTPELSFYEKMAQEEMDRGSWQRDVTRADTLRRANEQAIAEGMGSGNPRYRALMDEANASANVYDLQSRNDAATRAQNILMQGREEEVANIDRQLDLMDTEQKRTYLTMLNQGVSESEALTAAMQTKALSATQTQINEMVDQVKGANPGMSDEDAQAIVEERMNQLDEEMYGTLDDAAAMDQRIESWKQVIAENPYNVPRTTEDFKAVVEGGLLDKVKGIIPTSSFSLNKDSAVTLEKAGGITHGAMISHDGRYYRVEGLPFDEKGGSDANVVQVWPEEGAGTPTTLQALKG